MIDSKPWFHISPSTPDQLFRGGTPLIWNTAVSLDSWRSTAWRSTTYTGGNNTTKWCILQRFLTCYWRNRRWRALFYQLGKYLRILGLRRTFLLVQYVSVLLSNHNISSCAKSLLLLMRSFLSLLSSISSRSTNPSTSASNIRTGIGVLYVAGLPGAASDRKQGTKRIRNCGRFAGSRRESSWSDTAARRRFRCPSAIWFT